jgi:hypothetical protein
MTRRPTDIITAMLGPLTLFEAKCEEKQTLRKLIELANNRARWKAAHALFSEIRIKTLAAGERRDELMLRQYAFEEICAKTLYNLSRESTPFDPDSPFWVLPLAIELGLALGVTDLGEISSLLHVK